MKIRNSILIIGIILFVIGCATNPFTGKRTLALVSNAELFPMSFQYYNQFLDENKVVTNTAKSKEVKDVGRKIANASEKYLRANGYEGYLKDYKWEFNF